jgi:hypothetical protein
MDAMPKQFEHTSLSGLIDMAQPAFAEVGKKSEKRQAFWYRRTFTVEGSIPAVALLKIHKARYGTKVWLNGENVGEHLPCFTPALLDVKPHLKGSGQQNEIVVRVGADRESRPTDVPSGWDFEKYLYIPGIYDSVQLILTGSRSQLSSRPDIGAKASRRDGPVPGQGNSRCFEIACQKQPSVHAHKMGQNPTFRSAWRSPRTANCGPGPVPLQASSTWRRHRTRSGCGRSG